MGIATWGSWKAWLQVAGIASSFVPSKMSRTELASHARGLQVQRFRGKGHPPSQAAAFLGRRGLGRLFHLDAKEGLLTFQLWRGPRVTRPGRIPPHPRQVTEWRGGFLIPKDILGAARKADAGPRGSPDAQQSYSVAGNTLRNRSSRNRPKSGTPDWHGAPHLCPLHSFFLFFYRS